MLDFNCDQVIDELDKISKGLMKLREFLESMVCLELQKLPNHSTSQAEIYFNDYLLEMLLAVKQGLNAYHYHAERMAEIKHRGVMIFLE